MYERNLLAWNLTPWPQNNSCVSVLSRHHPGRHSPCMSAVHRCRRQAANSEREQDCCVFIKSTREQLRGLCSLDTPPLFIPCPPAVTLTFYFSLLIHSQIIFTKKKKRTKKSHTWPPGFRGSGRVSPTGQMCCDAVQSICLCQQPSRSSSNHVKIRCIQCLNQRTFFLFSQLPAHFNTVTDWLVSQMSNILVSHPVNQIIGWFLFCCVSLCATRLTVSVSLTEC